MLEGVAARGHLESAQNGIVRDPPQGEHRGALRQRGELGREIRVALADFGGKGLVVRRQAFDRVGDARVDEPQRVASAKRLGFAAETEVEQGSIEQNAGIVAGEGPPRGIGAMLPGRKPDDDQSRLAIPERRYGMAEIPRMIASDGVEEPRQAGTAATAEIVGCSGERGGSDGDGAVGASSHVEWRALKRMHVGAGVVFPRSSAISCRASSGVITDPLYATTRTES